MGSDAPPVAEGGILPGRRAAGRERPLAVTRLGDRAAWVVVAAFAGVQILIILLWANGPSLDESIYVTAGHRTLEGYAYDDRYLTWFAGSLGWPVLAAAGDAVAGLEGARLIAAALVTAGLSGVVGATGMLFGRRPQLAAAVLGATCGPVLVLGHLAVYDALAFGLLGTTMLLIALAVHRDQRAFVALASLAFTAAVLSKYPVLLFAVPIAWFLAVVRGPRAAADLKLAGAIGSALLLIYVSPQRQQLSAFLEWRVENSPSFGVTHDIIAFEQLWLLVLPALFAVGGLMATRARQRAMLLPLSAALLLVPAYHLAAGDSVGATKHAAMAVLIALPACGFGLAAATAPGVPRAAAVVALTAWVALGVAQARAHDRAWLDLRPATDFIAARAQPGETMLANASWPFVMRLYGDAKIASPWRAYDRYRVEQGEAGRDLCRHTWFVDTGGETEWPAEIRERIEQCPGFRLVWAERQRVSTIGAGGPVSYTAWVRVWRNRAA